MLESKSQITLSCSQISSLEGTMFSQLEHCSGGLDGFDALFIPHPIHCFVCQLNWDAAFMLRAFTL